MDNADAVLLGSFRGLDGHQASGGVEIHREGTRHRVRFASDFQAEKTPVAKVYLGYHYRPKGIELGRLTSFSGELSLMIPVGIDPCDYDKIHIHCETNDVGLACADLKPA